jgi:dTDP-glucose pyrophosphorylase
LTDKFESWQNTVLPLNSTVTDVINKLNAFSFKLVMVADENKILLGTISDGDIRRGLLKGLGLNSSIASIINNSPIIVSREVNREIVLQLMISNKIQQIPIVDENFRILGLHLWENFNSPLIHANIMVIMAGGKGVRLHPQTINCPKPLLPIGNKPILEHIIERAKKQGFANFIIAVNYLGHMIEDYFGEGDKLDVNIQYLHESSPLGTVGALSLLDPKPTSSFIVTNGDVIADINYFDLLNYHQQNGASATMAVREYEWQNPFGVVETQGLEIIGFEEKPIFRSNINAGVYVLEPSALGFLEKSVPCDMPTLLKRLQDNSERLIAFPIHERWLDIGNEVDFTKATQRL